MAESVRSGGNTELPVALLDQALDLTREFDWLLELVGLALFPAVFRFIRTQWKTLAAELPERLVLAGRHDGLSGFGGPWAARPDRTCCRAPPSFEPTPRDILLKQRLIVSLRGMYYFYNELTS
jgi:hypothetical protein